MSAITRTDTDLLIQAVGLTKVYRLGRIEVRALDGVDIEIPKGEFMAVMGRSGSGKSTLLNVLGCLDRPTTGVIVLDGIEVTSLPSSQLPFIRRSKIGFVFQSFNLIPTLTAQENVALPLRYSGVPGGERMSKAAQVLEQVGLGDRLKHRPIELSGGEQQRVALARALINDPAIVLADEPTGELDSQTALTIIEMLRELNRQRNQTFIIVTHDPMVAENTWRIVRLRDGRVESDQRW